VNTKETHHDDEACSAAELMIKCIAREIKDGDVVAQGIATPITIAGYYLAKLTHAPQVTFLTAIGNVFTTEFCKLSLTEFESAIISNAVRCLSFPEAVCELLPTLKPIEFFRPAQMDPYGNFNNICIGDYREPKIRLPGAAGTPDVTTYYTDIYLYVPNHSPKVFVEQLDFKSALGYLNNTFTSARRQNLGVISPGPKKVITNLCVFKFESNRLAIETIHPGVTVEEVIAQTGFEIPIPSHVHYTELPTREELELIRNTIDPYGIRELELISGAMRLHKIAAWR
jgi:glutaconate CoA-transferase subunit B